MIFLLYRQPTPNVQTEQPCTFLYSCPQARQRGGAKIKSALWLLKFLAKGNARALFLISFAEVLWFIALMSIRQDGASWSE